MKMTRKQRAEAFGSVADDLYVLGGNYPTNYRGYSPGSHDDQVGLVAENKWMQLHPDLLGEFQMFMTAFIAEVEQRFEEE